MTEPTGHEVQLLYTWFNHFNKNPAPKNDLVLTALEVSTRAAVYYREELGRLQISLDYTTQGETLWQHVKRSAKALWKSWWPNT